MSYRKEYGMIPYRYYHDGITTIRKKEEIKDTWEGYKLSLTDISLLIESLPPEMRGKRGKPL